MTYQTSDRSVLGYNHKNLIYKTKNKHFCMVTIDNSRRLSICDDESEFWSFIFSRRDRTLTPNIRPEWRGGSDVQHAKESATPAATPLRSLGFL